MKKLKSTMCHLQYGCLPFVNLLSTMLETHPLQMTSGNIRKECLATNYFLYTIFHPAFHWNPLLSGRAPT